jgi:hypothetical protein
MITSGLVLTLSADAGLAEQALATLRARPEFTLGRSATALAARGWRPGCDAASRDLHDWLNALPGVDFVDVCAGEF